MDTIRYRWKKNDATVEVWDVYIYIYIYICHPRMVLFQALNKSFSLEFRCTWAEVWTPQSSERCPWFPWCPTRGFSATKRKTHGGRWTAPKKSSKKPKFHPSIQGACEGITQTVCDGNLRGSSVRHRVAGFSKKNPWRQPSPQIILKARNPVWSGGRVEKTQVTSANAHVRMHPFTHECACMHGMYVRADGPT